MPLIAFGDRGVLTLLTKSPASVREATSNSKKSANHATNL